MRRMIGNLLGRLCSDAVQSEVCIIVCSKGPERTDIYHTTSTSPVLVLRHVWICRCRQTMLQCIVSQYSSQQVEGLSKSYKAILCLLESTLGLCY